MSHPRRSETTGLFDVMVDEAGAPPCIVADGCSVCRLFDHPRPGELRVDWYARVTGSPLNKEIRP